jgi:hypothetical protein
MSNGRIVALTAQWLLGEIESVFVSNPGGILFEDTGSIFQTNSPWSF